MFWVSSFGINFVLSIPITTPRMLPVRLLAFLAFRNSWNFFENFQENLKKLKIKNSKKNKFQGSKQYKPNDRA